MEKIKGDIVMKKQNGNIIILGVFFFAAFLVELYFIFEFRGNFPAIIVGGLISIGAFYLFLDGIRVAYLNVTDDNGKQNTEEKDQEEQITGAEKYRTSVAADQFDIWYEKLSQELDNKFVQFKETIEIDKLVEYLKEENIGKGNIDLEQLNRIEKLEKAIYVANKKLSEQIEEKEEIKKEILEKMSKELLDAGEVSLKFMIKCQRESAKRLAGYTKKQLEELRGEIKLLQEQLEKQILEDEKKRLSNLSEENGNQEPEEIEVLVEEVQEGVALEEATNQAMTPEEIAELVEATAEIEEPKEEKKEEATSQAMTPEEIEELIEAPAEIEEPKEEEKEEKKIENKIMTPEEIAALLAANQEDTSKAEKDETEEQQKEEIKEEKLEASSNGGDPNKIMTPEDIAALLETLQ